MPNVQLMDQEQSLKQMDLLPEEAAKVQAFDITDKVMAQISGESSRTGDTKAAGKLRMRKSFAVPAMVAACVLGLSVTGYAASQFLELRGGNGKVVVNTVQAPAASEESATYTQLWNQYYQEVKDSLQPGEYAAYYVKDEIINQADEVNPVKFAYQEARFNSFTGLQAEIARTDAPELSAPSAIPDGYTFAYGYVYPKQSYPDGLKDPEYRAIAEGLIRQADKAADSQKLFIRKLDWSQADFTFAQYSKGEHTLTITVRQSGPEVMLTNVMQSEQDTAEKLSIHGTEAYYIKSSANSPSGKSNHLGWLDESKHLFYQIYDDPGSPLSKADLEQVAASLQNAR